MAWFISQSAIMIGLAFLVGLLVGWLIWGRLLHGSDRKAAAPTVEQPAPVVEPASQPVRIPAPRGELADAGVLPVEKPIPADPSPAEALPAESLPAEPLSTESLPAEQGLPVEEALPGDDLARIEGIGPKIADALVAAGIRTFSQLAGSEEDVLTKAINDAGITFAPSLVTWAQQARLLADGDEEGFASLTARLIAGRSPDDALDRIEGIGPQIATALGAAGIRTYRVLAESSETRLRNAIEGAGITFAPSLVTWAQQARLLADGDEEGFADLTRRLVAGRDEGRS